MNTNHRQTGGYRTNDTAPHDPGTDWWADTVDRINTWWIHRQPATQAIRDWTAATPPRIVATVTAILAAFISVVVTVVVWLVSALYTLAAEIAASGRHTATTGSHQLAAWQLTRIITNPVHTYLTGHAATLHVSPHLLWTGWLATTGVLFVLAVLGSTGARIGWTITGALTTAAVYAATPVGGQTLAAGITVTAWCLLSIAAFNQLTRHHTGRDITFINRPMSPAGATPEPATATDHRKRTS